MRIALCQRNLTVGDFDGNVDRLVAAVRDASDAGADVAVCSELAVPGYPPRDLLERNDFVDGNLRALERFARAAPLPSVIGFVDRAHKPGRGRVLYNAAAVCARGAVRSTHHKSLLPTYDVFDEWRYFEPADVVSLADVAGVAVGVSICEDIWNEAEFWSTVEFWPQPRYERDPMEELARAGAELFINISASPFAVQKRALRPRVLAAQAKKHRRPLIMVNQVGGNDDLIFDGASTALSSDGRVGARAREFAEDMIVVDVDLASGRADGPIRDAPPLEDAGDAAAAVDALCVGTRDYVRKCGFRDVVVGLSGGIDSAVTAAIAARALGPERVWGVSMPSRYSSEHSQSDASALASALGIRYEIIPIEAAFRGFLEALAPVFAERAADTSEENLQARARGTILMALSNKFGPLVLTTGNKSELAVGYCTLYGDMAGGLAVLSDVPKTMVYELARELNRRAGSDVIPRSTIAKPPSAELRPDQTDQDSLPSYAVLDEILLLYVEHQLSRDAIVQRGLDAAIVDRVLKMVRANEYKREQAALGLKIRAKAFGRGRRMPLAGRW